MLKKYYMLLTLIVNISLLAMDRPVSPLCFPENVTEKHCCGDSCLNSIRDTIDKEILKLNTDGWCRSFVGFCWSMYENTKYHQNVEQATQRLCDCELAMPLTCRNYSNFEQLQAKHWHTSFLMNELIEDVVKQLRNVKGSTIDTVLNTKRRMHGLSQKMSSFIHKSAHKRYAQEMGLDRPLEKFNFGDIKEEIHFIPLQQCEIHSLCTMLISLDNKHVRGMTSQGKQHIWNVHDGTVDHSCLQDIAEGSQCFKDAYIVTSDYLAAIGVVHLPAIHSIMRKLYSYDDYQGIVLFKRPTLASFLYQLALKQSVADKQELSVLKKSAAESSLISGFSKANLLRLIKSELKKSKK